MSLRCKVALRWERLKNRNAVHQQCVDTVTTILKDIGVKHSVIGREELHRGVIQEKDLIIAIGGDGTVLNASSFLDDSIPILGVNSDPTKPEEQGVLNVRDERRSRGALCAATATNVNKVLPMIIYGEISPGLRSRIQCLVRSTHTETRLPPALNDILVAHPIPAAVSRFRLTLCAGNVAPSFKPTSTFEEVRFENSVSYSKSIIVKNLLCFCTAFSIDKSPQSSPQPVPLAALRCSHSMFGRVASGYLQQLDPLRLFMLLEAMSWTSEPGSEKCSLLNLCLPCPACTTVLL